MTWSGTAWNPTGPAVNGDFRATSMSIARDDAGTLFSIVGMREGVEEGAFRNRILRLDSPTATVWTEVGAALPDEALRRPASLIRAKKGHLFAAFALGANGGEKKLWTLDVTKAG